jgi:serine/threonine protein kinase/formylglycine-generating enzyme required for sulfatase activity
MINKTILHYNIISKIGEGGMGIVYKAEDTKLKREVAIKFLPHNFSVSDKDKEKLKTEAQIAAGLNHPNIATVYAIEELGDDTFIVMEYVKGKELKDVIRNSPDRKLNFNDFLNYAIQITEGLNVAHKKGIIHRDIKTSNIMLSDDGRIRVMDFGLAHIHGDPLLTKKGSTPGTTAYMSPEQLRGEEVDFRADIWSLGIVFFEMITGQPPFQGTFDQAIIYSILHEKPKSLRKINPEIPEELEQIILACLEKDPKKRIQSAENLLAQLKALQSQTSVSGIRKFSPSRLKISRAGLVVSIFIAAVLIILAAFLPMKKIFNPVNVAELTQQLDEMVLARNYFGAYDLAKEYQNELKGDSLFKELSLFIYDTLSITTEPERAKIFLNRFDPSGQNPDNKGEYAGVTPINNLMVARGDYLVTIEKDGYSAIQRIASSFPIIKEYPVPRRGVNLSAKMLKTNEIDSNMVFVPGGEYTIVSWSLFDLPTLPLNDFHIDKYEVSNSDYKQFISAGGYLKKEFWKHPFIKDGKEISWNEAMKLFVDRSQLSGPRSWINQEFPEGKENYPVTDITWYEAAAYAEFRGKSLPTVYQWEKAARNGAINYQGMSLPWGVVYSMDNVSGRANFNGKGTEPVDKYEFGISAFGCYNMAGNVKEWCLNNSSNGFSITGGSWEDIYYVYGDFGSVPGFFSSNSLGFRCVKNILPVENDPAALFINKNFQVPAHKPVGESEYKRLATYYKYDKKPLNAKVISREEKENWIEEKIEFDCPLGDRITGFLFLPKNVQEPFQTIVWDPHGAVYELGAPANWTAEILFSGNIKSGRGLFVIVPKGSPSRKWEYGERWPNFSTVLYRDRILHWVTEHRIGFDYLSTRKEIDIKKIAWIPTSQTDIGLIVPAVDDRINSIILIACGIYPESNTSLPEVNPINFVSRYNKPTYFMYGKYDEAMPYNLLVLPFYKLLKDIKGTELVNSGHIPPIELRVPLINKWLDESLGHVKFKE